MEKVQQKKDLRKQIRQLKASADIGAKDKMSLSIQIKLLEMEEVSSAGTILLYHSLPDEVSTKLLLEKLSNKLSGNKRIVLPVVDGDNLVLKEYVPNELNVGYRNILEPCSDIIVSPCDIDLAIIPGVAFDSNCNRMGRGKGFYDRLLPNLRCKTIGLAFSFQMVHEIPCEPFDCPLDMVVTDTGIYCAPLRLV